MNAPSAPETDTVVLTRATHELLLRALDEASQALRRTHRLRATNHIFLEGGIRMTRDNSFQINHGNPLLLTRLAQQLLQDG
jgi:hypothetical protein